MFTVSAQAAERAEGTGTTGLFTFQIARPHGGEASAASVDWRVVGSGANPAGATDFVSGILPSGTVQFAAGEVTKTITIQVAADAVAELDEGFAVLLSNPSTGFALINAAAQGTIRNDDGAYRPGYLGTADAEAAVSYVMAPNEVGFLTSGTAASDVTGNGLENRIAGNNAANRILGLAGNDILSGEGGNDTIDGGVGADRMHGGSGNDMFIVDNASDEVAEDSGAGIDRVLASVDYELPTSIERLDLIGVAALSGTGNQAANTIVGNTIGNLLFGRGGNDVVFGLAGNDTLDGGAGADRLDGGLGRDAASYGEATAGVLADLRGLQAQTGAAAGDVFVGIEDLVGSSFADTLFGSDSANLLAGGSGDDTVSGAGGNDTIDGGVGNDTLDGGAGADRLLGDIGNDVFVVEAGDVVIEMVDQGIDSVRTTAAAHTLAANVENLIAEGAAARRFVGNTLNNAITGNAGADTLYGVAGNDTLDGGNGIDRLIGGLGDDVYLTTTGDVVVEALNQGIDEVRTTSAAFVLGLNIENLTATNAIAHTLTGNTLNNIITGNIGADTLNGGAGNDTIDGGAGIDRLIGGLGDDVFFVTTGDVVVEGLNQGTDTVRATSGTAFTLGLNVEVLVLAGGTLLNGAGNTLDNIIIGNANANVLSGQAGADALVGDGGHDVLIGGAGQDTLTGGTGNDQFRINAIAESTVAAPDLILDFSFAAATGIDRVDLRAIDANTGLAGDQAFTYRGANFTGASGDLRVQASGGGVYVAAGDVNGDSVADFAITIQSATGPGAGWFLL